MPQIAARADLHLRVTKTVDAGRTRASVVALDSAEAVEELVRMMAGTKSMGAAEAFARELLAGARAERSGIIPGRPLQDRPAEENRG